MARTPRKRPPKIGKSYGVTTGLTVGQFLVKMFEAQYVNHYTDDYLAHLLADEFPKGPNYRPRISFYRNIYNRGEWACQLGRRPDLMCHRYGGEGRVIERSPGPVPRYLKKAEEAIEKIKTDFWARDPTIQKKMDRLYAKHPGKEGKHYRETHPETKTISKPKPKKKKS